jgi:hypothetical protein
MEYCAFGHISGPPPSSTLVPLPPTGDDIYILFVDHELHPFIQLLGELSINTPELKKLPIKAAD